MDYWTARYEEENAENEHRGEVVETVPESSRINVDPAPQRQMMAEEFFEGLGALLAVFEHFGKASNKGYLRTKARLNTS